MGEGGQAFSASGDFTGRFLKPGRLASHSYAFVFFAALALLSSAFAAAPWQKMDYGTIDGYGDLALRDSVSERRVSDEPLQCDGRSAALVDLQIDSAAK